MKRIRIQDRAQNTKNSTIALLSPIVTMGDEGSQYCIEPSGGGTQFTGDKHKLCYIRAPYFSNMTNTTSFFRRGVLYSCHV
jgi:hypothetical protein